MKRFILILAATATLMASGLAWTGSTEARDWARPGPARYYTGFGVNYGPYNRPYYRPYYNYGYRPYYYRSAPYYYGYPYGRGAYLGGPRAGVYFRY